MKLEDATTCLRADAAHAEAWAVVVRDVEARCEAVAHQFRAVQVEEGRAVVEEVKTEAVVRVVRRILDLSKDEIAKPRAYVATVVRHAWIDVYRRLHPKSAKAPVERPPEPADLVRADPRSVPLLEQLVAQALADVVPRYRPEQAATFTEIRAMFFEGQDYASIVQARYSVDPASPEWDAVCGRLYTRHRRARKRLRAAAEGCSDAELRTRACRLVSCLAWCRKSPARARPGGEP